MPAPFPHRDPAGRGSEARLMHCTATMSHRSWAFVALLTTAGCVSQGKYDEAVAGSQRLREQLQSVSQSDTERAQALARVEKDLAAAKNQTEALKDRLALTLDTGNTRKRQLDEATALNASLRGELERLGKDVDKLLVDRGALGGALTEAKARLEELRRAQAAAENRAKLFRSLALKLKKMVDSGELSIQLREGRMVLTLPNDVLFDSGKAKLKPAGKKAVQQVAAVLSTVGERDFQVAGHTDNEPIRISGYSSNWHLSTARALEVVSLLEELRLPPKHLSAAGYGEFDPVADNGSAEGRSKNRRIEITLQPNIEELVAVP